MTQPQKMRRDIPVNQTIRQLPPARSCKRPAEPPDCRDLPHPVTFFMSGKERSQILRALRRIDGDRVYALKRALGLA